jgi:hypothetical protein
MHEGVIFAKLRGLRHVIMETDCLEIVNLWNNRRNYLSIVAPILLEIGELASTFIVFSIQHVIRSANYLAHLCAKRASTLGVSESWVTGTPSFWLAAF